MATTTAGAANGAPTVVLPQGTYTGVLLSEDMRYPVAVEAFRGIPYAESTGGDNRLRSPVPLKASNHTASATDFGPRCPTGGGKAAIAAQGEDCLTANVYRLAARPSGEKAPVVVYVHGGGFNGGVGQERNMASFISFAKHPIVSVSFNYRLGALGFLPSARTSHEGILNLGLKDQQLLFQWVKDNIAAFGGDPDNVTLMGLSAGAHSIGHHLMSYTKENAPFHKAILESGAATARSVLSPTHPRHLVQFREFLVAAGVEGVWDDEVVDALRKLPLRTIQNASSAVWQQYQGNLCWPFQPAIDGGSGGNDTAIVPDLPIASWRRGAHLRIPIITGFNTNEGANFVPLKVEKEAEFRDFFTNLIRNLDKADVSELERLYPVNGDAEEATPQRRHNGHRGKHRVKGALLTPGRQFKRLADAYGDYAYITPVLQTAHFMSRAGGDASHEEWARAEPVPLDSASSSSSSSPPSSSSGVSSPSFYSSSGPKPPAPSPVYVYQYAALSNRSNTALGAANHGDEAAAVAHEMEKIGRFPGLVAVSDALHGAMVNFVVSREGDPNQAPPRPAGVTEDGWEDDSSSKMVFWPPFTSPFLDRGGEGGHPVASGDGDGQIVVFGEGNDERMGTGGHAAPGVVAKVEKLTDRPRALERYRFWWDRVELSEGLGQRDGDSSSSSNSSSSASPVRIRSKL